MDAILLFFLLQNEEKTRKTWIWQSRTSRIGSELQITGPDFLPGSHINNQSNWKLIYWVIQLNFLFLAQTCFTKQIPIKNRVRPTFGSVLDVTVNPEKWLQVIIGDMTLKRFGVYLQHHGGRRRPDPAELPAGSGPVGTFNLSSGETSFKRWRRCKYRLRVYRQQDGGRLRIISSHLLETSSHVFQFHVTSRLKFITLKPQLSINNQHKYNILFSSQKKRLMINKKAFS